MIVVSDTSPIRALAHLKLLDLLHDLYGEVLVPPAVHQELLHPPDSLPAVDTSSLAFVRIQAPGSRAQVNTFLQSLDLGESEALALAMEVQANVILIDEAEGRKVAENLGLLPVGAVGVLLRAKEKGSVDAVAPLLHRLENELKFFISAQFRARALRLAGESP